MRYLVLPAVFALAATVALAVEPESPTLKVVGSDLLKNTLSAPLTAYHGESGLRIEVEFLGSLPAMSSLREGNAALGLVAIPPGDPLPEDRYHLYPLAYQVAFVIVNAANPASEITLPELDRMYSAETRERIERWGQLGLTGSVAGRSVQMYVLNAPDSVVIELFKQRALGAQSLRSNVTTVNNIRRMSEQISGDLGGIGIANQGPAGPAVKAIPVSTGETGSFAFGPTPENVYYGNYPLVLPFYIAVPRRNGEEAKEVVRFLLSDEVASQLSQSGFMPLAENIRKRTLAELDMRF